MMTDEILRRYVALHNAGVRAGDFGPVIDLFHPDAELCFTGLAIGPFKGRDAIAGAFATSPPDDALWIGETADAKGMGSDTDTDSGVIEVVYGWAESRERPSGWLRMEARDGLILRLQIRVA